MNTAVHTPLLRTLYPKDILEETGLHTESRAGFSEYIGGCDTISTRGCDTDMKKVQQYHRSPKCVISLDKTPTVVGGNL